MNLKAPLLAILGVLVAAALVVGGMALAGVFDSQPEPVAASSTTSTAAPATTTSTSVPASTTTTAPETTTTTDPGVPGDAVADAGEDQFVVVGTEVTLDGTGSSDPLGSELTYRWQQTGGPDVTGGTRIFEGVTPTFTAPVDPAGVTFSLVVYDGTNSEPSDVRIQFVLDDGPAVFVDPAAEVEGLQMGTIDAPLTSFRPAVDMLSEVGVGTIYITRTLDPILIDEFFVIPLGVSIAGGFDDEFLYASGQTTFRATGAPMYIAGPGGSTVISKINLYGQHEGYGAVGLAAESGDDGGSFEIRGSTIAGPRATEGNKISSAVAVSGPLDVVISGSKISAGAGVNGKRGVSGDAAAFNGATGNDANKATGGKGGPGLNGGDGGSALGGAGGNGAGPGGAGGGFDQNGQSGTGGEVPVGGTGGRGAERTLEITANAGQSGSAGSVGASGGGGGGGGGTIGLKGGGGGEGGTGGAAGQGGGGGGGGGASIGLFVSITGDLSIIDSEIVGGRGGSGGSGGGGSFGGLGGKGGFGAPGSCSFLGCGSGQAGSGGNGAGGSRGSQGGDGGGGAGGNSYGIYLVTLDGSMTIERSMISGGSGGRGGQGGDNGSQPQQVGATTDPPTGFIGTSATADRGADGGSTVGIYATAGAVDTSLITIVESEVLSGTPGLPGTGPPANSGLAISMNW